MAQTCIIPCICAVHIVQKQHAYNGGAHAPTRAGACMHLNRHTCRLMSAVLTFYPNMRSCVFANMHKEQRKACAWGLFVNHLEYYHARWSVLVHCARCASRISLELALCLGRLPASCLAQVWGSVVTSCPIGRAATSVTSHQSWPWEKSDP